MNTLDWIESTLKPVACNSVEFFYDEMESQSGYALPILYQPFNPCDPLHWLDRGSILDFLFATQGEGKTLLDFGPGDGWPSLIVAPFAREVVGVDGSAKRVEVCTQNAARLGISNARFLHVVPGTPLPFADETFDGVMAASSIEQTPDPRAILGELFRVLRPGGRLRIYFEALDVYSDGREQEADLEAHDESSCILTIYDRHIAEETARMFRLTLGMPLAQASQIFAQEEDRPLWNGVTIPALEQVQKQILAAHTCTLTHASGQTFSRWMKEIGFTQVLATHWGGWFAFQLYNQLKPEERPQDLAALDNLLRPLVKIVVDLEAPWILSSHHNPLITAVK